jgi:hypothetical protein
MASQYSGKCLNCRRQLASTEGIKPLSEIPPIQNNTHFAEEPGISLNGKESPLCGHDEINKMV